MQIHFQPPLPVRPVTVVGTVQAMMTHHLIARTARRLAQPTLGVPQPVMINCPTGTARIRPPVTQEHYEERCPIGLLLGVHRAVRLLRRTVQLRTGTFRKWPIWNMSLPVGNQQARLVILTRTCPNGIRVRWQICMAVSVHVLVYSLSFSLSDSLRSCRHAFRCCVF